MDQKLRKADDADSFNSQIQSPELRLKLLKLAAQKFVPIDDREDIVSEAIVQAIANQEGYDPVRGAFFSWISGITKNVIRSYYRKLKTQKRRPAGGVVSSDAASACDEDNPRELADKPAEVQRKSAEDAQHYIDAAGLSEKERNAIAYRLDKQPQYPKSKFSSSTARRAMKKLKQARSDERFRKGPQGPERSECAYGKIPLPEHDTALLYDSTRRISWFTNSVAQWRDSPLWKEIQAFLHNERAAKRFPLTIRREHWPEEFFRYREAAHERDPVLRRRFEAAVDIALAFSEWPRMGYCRLAPNERRQRLEQFGWQFGSEPFWEIDNRTFEIFVDAADEKQLPIESLPGFLEFVNQAPFSHSHTYSSTHLIRIDWRYPLKTIVESFKKWASKQPNPNRDRIAQSGRSRTTRLVGFACIRLTDDFGLNKADAMSWLKQWFGAPIPLTPERLERAVRATRDSLKDFLPSPAKISV